MKILGIETSCDETAVCIIEADGGLEKPTFKILGNALYSQVKLHAEYGGVFPSLAKREHAKNLVPLFKKALLDASMLIGAASNSTSTVRGPLASPRAMGERGEVELQAALKKILEREIGLFDSLIEFIETIEKPDIDLIAVTAGPGLEPALWVGINFALALGQIWNIPVMPTNHMEGHIVSPLLFQGGGQGVIFPALALLISGGHTELDLVENWHTFKLVGQTRDDAVGEAFDKVARLLGLPYPGGPEISKLAAEARKKNISSPFTLPRPMIKSDNFDFSFSGIKTAVLYGIKKLPELALETKMGIAREFEDAVTEVLISKTRKALDTYHVKTLILGGGVIANSFIRNAFKEMVEKVYSETALLIPDIALSTDNAVMIAMAGYIDFLSGKKSATTIVASGNLSLAVKN
jgi:N6-L-threonylcarbamoyladenine synthase